MVRALWALIAVTSLTWHSWGFHVGEERDEEDAQPLREALPRLRPTAGRKAELQRAARMLDRAVELDEMRVELDVNKSDDGQLPSDDGASSEDAKLTAERDKVEAEIAATLAAASDRANDDDSEGSSCPGAAADPSITPCPVQGPSLAAKKKVLAKLLKCASCSAKKPEQPPCSELLPAPEVKCAEKMGAAAAKAAQEAACAEKEACAASACAKKKKQKAKQMAKKGLESVRLRREKGVERSLSAHRRGAGAGQACR